jgi:DNA polymerase III subunit delta
MLSVLKNEIKENKFKNFYLFYGEEDYLKAHYQAIFLKAIVTDALRDMNVDVFEEKNINISNIEDAANTLPFMAEYRVIIIKKSDLFIQGKKDEQAKMLVLLGHMSANSVILFVEDKIDKRNSLYKKINSDGLAVEFKSPPENDLAKWVSNMVKKKSLTISPKNVSLFIRTISGDMNLMSFEIEKLSSFKNKGEEILEEDIKNVCTKSLEVKIFDMIDAISYKNKYLALDIFNNLIVLKESPIMVISMMARQFRLILQCKLLKQKNIQEVEIANLLGIRSFSIKSYIKQGYNYSEEKLLQGLNDFLEADINIKQGKINDKMAVEILIIKYSQ